MLAALTILFFELMPIVNVSMDANTLILTVLALWCFADIMLAMFRSDSMLTSISTDHDGNVISFAGIELHRNEDENLVSIAESFFLKIGFLVRYLN